MDLRKLKTLIDLVSDSNISELEITEADGKVRIVKTDKAAVTPVMHYTAAPIGAASVLTPIAAPLVAASAPAAAGPSATEEPQERGHVVKSPMVGTFYRSASPGGDPF